MKNSNPDHTAAMAPSDRLEPVLALMETDGEAALARLDALVELYVHDPRLYFMSGSVLAGLERYTEARTAMQRAIDIAPDYGLARFQLGFLALTSGDAVGARSIWLPLMSLPADDPLKLFAEGLAAMLSGHFDEAISLLETGIRRNEALMPLNKNMAILIQEMRERLKLQAAETEVESGAHFLLKQYSFKDTRH